MFVEKDQRFYEILKEKFKSENSLKFYNKDILKYNLNEFII